MTLAEVRERDLWGCVRCGSKSSLHVHHRCRRAQGGKDAFSNLITLCAECHHWVHHNIARARLQGWLLGRWQVAAEVPVDHFAWPMGSVLLADDGTVRLWSE